MNKKALSLPILTSLVVGNMIGTGIYILPATLAPFGYYSLLAWMLTSLGALFLALTFAHLSKRFPETGGPITYSQAAFGRLTGCVVSYIYWASNLVSISGLAISSTGYLGYLIAGLDPASASYHPWMGLCVELGIVWLFTLINVIGIHTAGVTQLYLTIIKVLPLFVISLIGLSHVHLHNFALPATGASTPGLTSITSAAALTFWAFIGLESATVPSESTSGYKTIYRATIYGTLITAVVYMLGSFVLQGMISPEHLQNSTFPFAEAAIVLFGSSAAVLVSLCAFVSGIGALNGCLLLQGQIVYAAARNQFFPKRFSKMSKHDVPIAGQLLSSILISIVLAATIQPSLLKQFSNVALLASLLTLITYLITACAEFKFSAKTLKKAFKPFVISMIAVVYAAWMITNFDKTSLLISLVLMALVLPVYYLFAHQPRR